MSKDKNLFDRNSLLQTLLDGFRSCVAILDHEHRIAAVNQEWISCSQRPGKLVLNSGLGLNYVEYCRKLCGEGFEAAQQILNGIEAVSGGQKDEVIIDYACPAAQAESWYRVRISRLDLADGLILLVHDDVTAEKTVKIALEEREALFRSVIEQSSEGIALLDSQGRIIEWNASEERITGIPRHKAMGRFMWDVQYSAMPPKTSTKLKRYLKQQILQLLQTGFTHWVGKPTEVTITKPDGSESIIQSVIFPIKQDHTYLACSMTRDITDLKRSVQAFHLTEERLRTYIRFSPMIALVMDRDGNFIDVNPEACAQMGYSEAQFHKLNIRDLVPDGDEEISAQLHADLLKHGQVNAEISMKRHDGRLLQLSSRAVILPDDSIMILASDISELKQYQHKLSESEAFLNNILDHIPSMITVKEAGNLQYYKVNHPVEEFLGESNDSIRGKTAEDFFQKDEASFITQQDTRIVEDKSILDIPHETVTTRDHEKRVFHEKKVPMFDEYGKPSYILSIAEDITEQIGLEADARSRLMRLEVISQLSTSLQTIQSLDEMLPVLLDTLQRVVKAPMASIWLHKTEYDELVPVCSAGEDEDLHVIVDGPLPPGSGIPGRVYQTQEVYISLNYRTDEAFSEHKKEALRKDWGGITLPLRTTNSVIGAINLTVETNRPFTDEDVKLLTTLSEIAGNAIQNIALKEETEQRLMRLTALGSVDRAISSSLDLQVSLEILVSNVISQLNMDAADVLLFNPYSKLLEYSTGQGFYTPAIESARLGLGESLAGKAAFSRELVYVPDILRSDEFLNKSRLDLENFKTYYGVPLIAKGDLKGVLEVFKRGLHEPNDDWLSFLKALAEQAAIAIDNSQMFENLRRSNIELSLAYNATIEGWSHALDLRDKETEGHTQRVTELTERVARLFNFSEAQLKHIRWGALLHDIGKMGVPDGILLKPGALTDEEWKIMKMHPRYAFEMLAPIGYLSHAIDIPYCHHEKWDGSGYPRGLSGEQIPLAARIFAFIDIWDALRSDRPYRKAWPKDKVLDHLKSLSGNHLDPHIVKVCLQSGFFAD